jgi:8-oxo-dGTP pyrophosphatase MutT (NUDIX family)
MSSTRNRAVGEASLAEIRRALQRYTPQRLGDDAVARAGVAMVLRVDGGDAEMLLIQRAERHGDPWSGHVALPGGRRQPGDADVVRTALRETKEEVGIDLERDASVFGPLDDLVAVARDRPIGLVISPVVCALERSADLVLDHREVVAAVWVPLRELRRSEARATYRRTSSGFEADFPALRYRDLTIWGLTYRIIESFFEIV